MIVKWLKDCEVIFLDDFFDVVVVFMFVVEFCNYNNDVIVVFGKMLDWGGIKKI